MNAGVRNTVALWLPVVLLPAGNLIAALCVPSALDARLLLYSVIGAAAEELFFRLLLLKTVLLPRVRPGVAILATAVLFAALHLLNLRNGSPMAPVLAQVLCAFCFSVWAGAATWKSTWAIPLAAHVLLNLTAGETVPWASVLLGAIVLADGVLLIRETKGGD